jgi:hypothetical protein
LFKLGEHVQTEAAPCPLVSKRGVGEAVAQHHIAPRQSRFNHVVQVVAAGGKNQQGFAQRVHWIVQHHAAQFLRQGRAAGFAGLHHCAACGFERLRQGLDVAGLARAVDAFETDEQTGLHAAYCALALWPRW